jgi:hypothetical protein
MTNRIGNLTPEELVDAMLKHQEMEQTHRYLNAGRRFRSFAPDELKALWILAVKKFWATRTDEAELELNNVAAELRLRRIKAPLFRVREELKLIQAEIERDFNDRPARVAVRASQKIEEFLRLLMDRKH